MGGGFRARDLRSPDLACVTGLSTSTAPPVRLAVEDVVAVDLEKKKVDLRKKKLCGPHASWPLRELREGDSGPRLGIAPLPAHRTPSLSGDYGGSSGAAPT
nr:unnamed protein product [Digitaria exilis]